MAGITQSQRKRAWNVHFVIGASPFAGIYQCDDFLTVADVARELALCLRFSQPPGAWQPILLPVDSIPLDARGPLSTATDAAAPPYDLTISREPFVCLDKTDTRPFPTPAPGHRTRYRYAFHQVCDDPRHRGATGALQGDPTTPFPHPFPYPNDCIRQASAPTRRRDPRYLPIKTKSTDERLRMAPLRNSRKRKASSDSIPTQSSARSWSLDTGVCEEEVPMQIISPDKGQYMVDKFRTNVLTGGVQCAVTGKGASWLGMGLGGPGIEVAHIVPQCHWNTYPLDEDQRVADRDVKQELERAWRLTWSEANGLPLLSHIHKCFEARLLAIHPTTYRIRTFAWYDVLNEYHGQLANVSADVDPIALRHHWDMCCLENIVAESVPDVTDLSSQPLPASLVPDPLLGASLPPAMPTTPKAGSPSAPDALAPPDGRTDRYYTAHPAHPLSPPASDAVVQVVKRPVGDDAIAEATKATEATAATRRQTVSKARGLSPSAYVDRPCPRWRIGQEVITDPNMAARLRLLGWTLEDVCTTDEASPARKRKRRGPHWRIGAHVIEDESEAQRLRDQDWIVDDVPGDSDSNAADDSDREHHAERGRSQKRRRI